MNTIVCGFGTVALCAALAACSPRVLTEATTFAADTCTLANAANAADPALCTHNAKACAIGQAACTAAPGILAGLEPVTAAPPATGP